MGSGEGPEVMQFPRPMVAEIHCTCLSISRDPLCFFHGDRDKTNIVRAYNPEAGEKITP